MLSKAANGWTPVCSEPAPRPEASTKRAVRRILSEAAGAILDQAPRVMSSDDVRSTHKMRAGARRLRSLLQTFRPILDHGWVNDELDELRRLSARLGSVRDLDVLRIRFQAEPLEFQSPAIFERLDQLRVSARSGLIASLASEEARELHGMLLTIGKDVPFEDVPRKRGSAVLPRLVARQWCALAKLVRTLPADRLVPAHHEARKQAKTLRYAAEAVAPWLAARDGKRAERFARAVSNLQGTLGELQDAILAGEWLEANFQGAGRMALPPELLDRSIQLEREAAQAVLEKLPALWRELDRKKLRRWMKS
jgi:CHAD domain-containing protein